MHICIILYKRVGLEKEADVRKRFSTAETRTQADNHRYVVFLQQKPKQHRPHEDAKEREWRQVATLSPSTH